MARAKTYTYKIDEKKDTCKTEFKFKLKEIDGKLIIIDLIIKGEKGCIGQNNTIALLLKGRPLEEIPIKELAKAGCRRTFSCNQELAKALGEILEKY